MNEKNNLKSWELVNFCEFDKYATKVIALYTVQTKA